jgi:putative ABC transport system permease protein
LLWRSFYAMYVRELGVDASGVVSMRLTLPVEKYDTPDKRRQFISRLEAGLRDVSGFESTALTTTLPFSFGAPSRTLSLDGVVAAPGVPAPSVTYIPVSEGYFAVLRLSLREGRLFRSTAASTGQTEAVVDQRFATLYFPGSSPVGRRIRLERPAAPGRASSGSLPPAWLTIVGVAPTIATARPGPESAPVVYAAMGDDADPTTTLSILVRSDRDAAASTAALRERVRTLDADLPLYAVETLGAVIAQSRAPQRLLGRWFGIIAMIALVLATVGIWGVTAHAITQRQREIGVRIALGARTSQIVWLFARGTGGLVALGLALGAAGALMTGPLLGSFLVQTDARDPLTLVAVAALLAAVALAASLIPARRASRLDPVSVLRRD